MEPFPRSQFSEFDSTIPFNPEELNNISAESITLQPAVSVIVTVNQPIPAC